MYSNRGNARVAKGDLEGAFRDYGEAIRLDPHYAGAYYNRGNARVATGDLDLAREDYAQTVRLRPDHANAHYNLAGLLKHGGRHADAIVHYQTYLDLGGSVRAGDQAAVEKIIRDLGAMT